MRDVLVHGYYRIDDDTLWTAIRDGIPELADAVRDYLDRTRSSRSTVGVDHPVESIASMVQVFDDQPAATGLGDGLSVPQAEPLIR